MPVTLEDVRELALLLSPRYERLIRDRVRSGPG
jgi:hypothetical protein